MTDPWHKIGRGIETDIQRAAILTAAALVTFGGVLGIGLDVLLRRHRKNR